MKRQTFNFFMPQYPAYVLYLHKISIDTYHPSRFKEKVFLLPVSTEDFSISTKTIVYM